MITASDLVSSIAAGADPKEARVAAYMSEDPATVDPREGLDELLDVADGLGALPPAEARLRLLAVQRFLESVVLPHEVEDEAAL